MFENMIPIYEPYLSEACKRSVCKTVRSGFVSSQAPVVKDFESAVSGLLNCSDSVAVANCTLALELALRVAGVGPGDNVIVPNLTFIAPANVVKLVGANLLLVDVDPVSLNITLDRIKAVANEKTKAVILVHAFGQAIEEIEIYDWCREKSITTIDDVAESFGTFQGEAATGTLGDFGCYSFFANKMVTCGEGGVLIAKDEKNTALARLIRDHGMTSTKRYHHNVLASNYRMTAMQAALGLSQLKLLEANRDRKQWQYECMVKKLDETGVGSTSRIFSGDRNSWVNWLNTLFLDDFLDRSEVISKLKNKGIECRPMIFPVSEAAHFRSDGGRSRYPVSYLLSYRGLHLPSGPQIDPVKFERLVDIVCEVISK